jgi:hypothetical protein
MAQQQLLLIILVVIVLGLAIAVGIALFADSAVDANRDAVSQDLVNLAVRAHEFYRRPSVFNGGGGSFVGLTADAGGIAKLTNLPGGRNGNGTYSVHSAGTANNIVLQGVGTEVASDGNYVTSRILVRTTLPDSVYIVY